MSEIQNLEHELWNLTMQGSEITPYTTRFNDLETLCRGMFSPEYKKIEHYIWGLAPKIQGMVTASRPSTFESVKSIAIRLTDQGISQGTMVQKVEPKKDHHKRKSLTHNKPNPPPVPQQKQQTITAFAATAPTNTGP